MEQAVLAIELRHSESILTPLDYHFPIGVGKMVEVSSGDFRVMEQAVLDIELRRSESILTPLDLSFFHPSKFSLSDMSHFFKHWRFSYA